MSGVQSTSVLDAPGLLKMPLVLFDDAPNPVQVKMGPLGQIIRSGGGGTGTKKKKAAPTGSGAGSGAGASGGTTGGGGGGGEVNGTATTSPKKKKTGMVGVGTGNGRKKKSELAAGASAVSGEGGVVTGNVPTVNGSATAAPPGPTTATFIPSFVPMPVVSAAPVQ